jgi:hypothetical protein
LSCCGEARISIADRRVSSAKVIAKAITASSDAITSSPSSTSLSGLDGVNLFLAGMQSGFGPFVAVLLADEKWIQQNIGLVLSASNLAGLLSQLPGGELLDASRSKRFLVALGGSSSRSARSPSHFGQAWSLLPWCCKGSPAGFLGRQSLRSA